MSRAKHPKARRRRRHHSLLSTPSSPDKMRRPIASPNVAAAVGSPTLATHMPPPRRRSSHRSMPVVTGKSGAAPWPAAQLARSLLTYRQAGTQTTCKGSMLKCSLHMQCDAARRSPKDGRVFRKDKRARESRSVSQAQPHPADDTVSRRIPGQRHRNLLSRPVQSA